MRSKRSGTLSFVLAALIIGGCAARPDHAAFLSRQAAKMDARAEVVETEAYSLQTIATISGEQTMSGEQKTLRVYIKGDGRAWASRYRPSLDLTPVNPLVVNLMAVDPYPDKAYIARPCQYVKGKNCDVSVWTDGRYSRAVVDSLDEALDQLKQKGKYRQLELIGYSGGATLALLVAAHRDDVRSRTVAGNLDPHYVNTLHHVSPMPDALTPVDYQERLQYIPQMHLVGSEDTTIPPEVFSVYLSKFKERHCVRGKIVAGATHQNGWQVQWRDLLHVPLPECW